MTRALDVEAGHNAGMKGILFDPDNIINEDGNPDKRIKSMWELVDKKLKLGCIIQSGYLQQTIKGCTFLAHPLFG